MIGGLALGRATADITDIPPSPKPLHKATPQRLSAQGQLGTELDNSVAADTADLQPVLGSDDVHDSMGDAGPAGQGRGSAAQEQNDTAASQGGINVSQSSLSRSAAQPGSVQAESRTTALGPDGATTGLLQADAQAAANRNPDASSSTAAIGPADPRLGTSTGPRAQGTDSYSAPGCGPADEALGGAIFAAEGPAGWTAASQAAPQGAQAGPASIAAYRPGGEAAGPRAAARGWSGVRVTDDAVPPIGPDAAGLSLRRQSGAMASSSQSGHALPIMSQSSHKPGQPVQVSTRC